MDYQDFVGALSRCEGKNVKVRAIKNLCYPTPIPEAILPLFQDMMGILQAARKTLFKKDEKIIIFGIQFTPVARESDAPLALKRVFNPKAPKTHLSCSVQYVKKSMSDSSEINPVKSCESVIVDFTVGEVVDSNYYLSKITHQNFGGKLYGLIKSERLSLIWPAIQMEQVNFN